MGISGLLPLLKDAQEHYHISHFKGKTLAVDAYVWLHKGAFGCAEDLVKGKKTTKFVDYAMHRVRMLKHHGITPYIVFDGGPLPAKKGTEDKRAKSRAENLAQAQALEAQGKLTRAREFYTKCLDVTPEMAFQLIKALRAEQIEYVVAPYEADAQLCYLERSGLVDGIITEDSDLLVFGCQQVIFKLDNNGQCVSIHRDRLASLKECPMSGWTSTEFRRMAMLAGCDYLPSIPGIGIKKAYTLLRRHKTMEKLLQSIRLEGKHEVPTDYAEAFNRAELPFMHQRVYCPWERKLRLLHDREEGRELGTEEERWVGLSDMPVHIAQGVAAGDLHPETRRPIEDQWPNFKPQPRQRQPLAGSSKDNVAPAKGPMDVFLTRMPKQLKPVHIPIPIGAERSGPTTLHEQSMKRAFLPTQASHSPAEKVKSKFFGGGKPKRKPTDVEPAAVELVWDASSFPVAPVIFPDPPTKFEVAHARSSSSPHHTPPISSPVPSPSPCISSIAAATPRRIVRESLEDHMLTSPFSAISSPAASPTRSMRRSPRHRRASPSRIATAGSVVPETVIPTQASSAFSVRDEDVFTAGSSSQQTFRDLPSSQLVQPSLTPPSKRSKVGADGHRSRPLSTLDVNVRIAAPSPRYLVRDRDYAPGGMEGVSSDTIESDLLVTPSAEPAGPMLGALEADLSLEGPKIGPGGKGSSGSRLKRKSSSVKSDELSPEEAEEDVRRAEHAAGATKGWAAKWAFKPGMGGSHGSSRISSGSIAGTSSTSTGQRITGAPAPTPIRALSDQQARTLEKMEHRVTREGTWMTEHEKRLEKRRKREEDDVFSPLSSPARGGAVSSPPLDIEDIEDVEEVNEEHTGRAVAGHASTARARERAEDWRPEMRRAVPLTSCLQGLELPVLPLGTGTRAGDAGGGSKLDKFRFRGKVRTSG